MMSETSRWEPSPAVDALAHAVIGAAIEVHRHLGPGYLEASYQKAMEIELRIRGIAAKPQFPVALEYKGVAVGEGYLDFLVGGVLVVELKTVESLAPVHRRQVISYLKATGLTLGLLLNFNVPVMTEGIKRVIWNEPTPAGADELDE